MSSTPPLKASEFVSFVRLNTYPLLGSETGARGRARERVLEAAGALAHAGPGAVLSALPKLIGSCFEEFGWAWNGFYVLRGDGALHLSFAFGPPVCSQLDARGGVLSSGMCFDSLHMNQALAAHDTGHWPGYVSCDASSHLGTTSGIVVPLRDPNGRPIACWDLDAVQSIETGDVRFMDVLLSSLGRCVNLETDCFGPDA